MTTAATIWAKLLLDTTDYNKNVKDAKTKTKDMTDSGKSGSDALGKAFEKVTGVSLSMAGGFTLAAGAVVALVKYMGDAEKAAVESAKADAKVNAVLASTNYQAGMTEESLNSLATSLSKSAGIDDELVKSAEAVLLTFTNLNSDVFPRTMQVATDMNAVIGSGENSLQGTIEKLGMALNDFSGYTKLGRTIGGFSDEQKTTIQGFKDSNDLIGYQSYILGILETKYSGAAKAINDAGDGTENLKVAQENLSEAIGTKYIPQVRAWNKFWTDWFDNVAAQTDNQNKWTAAMESAGIELYGNNIYVKDGVRLTKEQAGMMIVAAESANKQAAETKKLGEETQQTDEEIKAMTIANEEYIKGVQTWQSMITSYSENMASLTEKQVGLESDLATARAQGYSDQSEKIQGILSDMDDVNKAIDKEKKAYELKTKTVILGYMQEKLAADGNLDDKETAWLIAKGVEWGIYSQDAVKAYEDASKAADDFLKHRQASEYDNSITVTTTYRSIYESLTSGGTSSSTAASIASGVASGEGLKHRALGGTTLAQQMYQVTETGKPEILTVGNDNYLMMGDQNGAVTPMDNSKESNIVKPTVKDSSANNRELARMFAEELRPFLK